MAIYSGNRFLSMAEMTENAQYILNYLTAKGWTKNAICGMLGNLQSESSINPGIWQSLNEGNMSGGFGLVQWTPATKYLDWCTAQSLIYTEMDSNLLRIIYEVENSLQWYNPSMTFLQFTKSLKTPYDLAMLFIKYYERPANPSQPQRGTQAKYWADNLTGGINIGEKPLFPTKAGQEITSPYGWRVHPITGVNTFHAAIDITGNNVNHPIYATQNAIVIEKLNTSYGGYTIRLKHTSDIYYSQYQHMNYASPLTVGAKVTKGQIIGHMGTTGDSTGIHLDFAIGKNESGWYTEEVTIDPVLYLEMLFNKTMNKKKSKVFLYLKKRRVYI